jgi:hypothetical protein
MRGKKIIIAILNDVDVKGDGLSESLNQFPAKHPGFYLLF